MNKKKKTKKQNWFFSETAKENTNNTEQPQPKRPIVAADGRRLKRRWISSGADAIERRGGWHSTTSLLNKKYTHLHGNIYIL